jgi:hypothetical protein
MKKGILERYPRAEDGRLIIDVTAGRVEDLYNHFDRDAPYIRKELDADLVEYITESVNEIDKEPFVIRFRLNEPPEPGLISRLQSSIQNYYLYLREWEARELASMLRTSTVLLIAGIAILATSVWFNQHIAARETVITSVFAEGLTIAAWIAMWESLATFIVNWAPHRRRIRLYERIAATPVLFN